MANSTLCKNRDAGRMIIISTYLIIGCLQTALCFISCKQVNQLYQVSKSSPRNASKFSKTLLCSYYMFYFFSFTFGISRITSSITGCLNSILYVPSFTLLFISYGLHFFWFEVLLYLRLQSIFKDTTQSISKCCSVTIYIDWIISLSLGGIYFAAYVSQKFSAQLILAWSAFMVILILTTCQVLAWMFVIKLHQTFKTACHSTEIESNLKWMSLIRKYGILSVFCVMFSLFYLILSLVTIPLWGISSDHSWWTVQMLSIFGLALDVFLDTLCMTISLKTNEKYYQYLCSRCHYGCCGGKPLRDKQIELNLIKQASLTAQQQITDAKSTTSQSHDGNISP